MTPDIQVAMVFGSGGLDEGGYYNQMGLKGLQQAQADFGVSFDYELPGTDTDFAPCLRTFAETGRYALVMTMSFGASAGLNRVAAEYPEQKFAAFDAHADRPNVANYASEPRGVSFLAGTIVAQLSETGKVGALFGTESAGYWQWVASYIAGVRHVAPEIEVFWEFLSHWSPTPAEGEAAAYRLYDQGVDIIMAHLDTGDSGVFAAARARDGYVLGFNGERHLDPDRVLFDVTRHLEVCVYDAIERVVQGKFEAGVARWGMERNQYGLDFGSPLHPKITPDVLTYVETTTDKINAGTYDPFPAKFEEIEPFLQQNRL